MTAVSDVSSVVGPGAWAVVSATTSRPMTSATTSVGRRFLGACADEENIRKSRPDDRSDGCRRIEDSDMGQQAASEVVRGCPARLPMRWLVSLGERSVASAKAISILRAASMV